MAKRLTCDLCGRDIHPSPEPEKKVYHLALYGEPMVNIHSEGGPPVVYPKLKERDMCYTCTVAFIRFIDRQFQRG